MLAELEKLLPDVQARLNERGEINKLVDLRLEAQSRLNNLKIECVGIEDGSAKATTQEKILAQQQESIDSLNRRIDDLYQPFLATESSVSKLLADYRPVLNAVAVKTGQLPLMVRRFKDEFIPWDQAHSDLTCLHNASRELTDCQVSSHNSAVAAFPVVDGTTWRDVKIRFTSEQQAQVTAGTVSRVLNYTELGFEDQRTKLPREAWAFLRKLAENHGYLSASPAGVTRPSARTRLSQADRNKDEGVSLQNASHRASPRQDKKRVQEIRLALKQIFHLEDDPFEPYQQAQGYCTKFQIECAPSYHGSSD